MGSPLKQLSDEDMEALNHMVRRDSATDREIADWAGGRLRRPIAPSLHAREAAIARYRGSAAYKRWLANWERRDVELKMQVEAQKQRYALIRELVSGRDADDGMDAVSMSIQARLLTLAAEATDQDLKTAASGRGWIANTLAVTRDAVRDQYRRQLAALKADIEKRTKGGKSLDPDALVKKVDELMGLRA